MIHTLSSICLLGCFASMFTTSAAQISAQDTTARRIVATGVPFLTFAPDARGAGLGDAGAALAADANSIHWNPAKLVFAEKDQGVALSYTPWLRNIADDMYLTYLAGYTKLGKNQVLGLSLLYFDLGTIDFTTNIGTPAGSFPSKEYAITASYSRRLTQNFSAGINARYINSNLAGNYSVNGLSLKPASTMAADISVYYQKEVRDDVSGAGIRWAFGGIISNIGGKVNYGTGGTNASYFLPTNLRLGTAVTLYTDKYNKFNFVLDLNKLLAPTPPLYQTANGQVVKGPDGKPVILKGKDPEKQNTLGAIFGSFADAPNGFGEELREINIALGAEYWYNDLFAARVGYYNEPRDKGNRKYFTAGLGLRVKQKYGIDFAYLMPVTQLSPLANTFRLSLVVGINKKDRGNSEE